MSTSSKIIRALGIDPSLTRTGFAVVDFAEGDRRVELVSTQVVATSADMPLPRRLNLIRRCVEDSRVGTGVVGIEDMARGSRFRREEAGMAHAAVQIGLAGFEFPVALVSPLEVKMVARPDWKGFSLANWKAAGMRSKFKRSMPSKEEVAVGLHRRFGVLCDTDDEVDAVCVAIAAAARISKVNVEAIARKGTR